MLTMVATSLRYFTHYDVSQTNTGVVQDGGGVLLTWLFFKSEGYLILTDIHSLNNSDVKRGT